MKEETISRSKEEDNEIIHKIEFNNKINDEKGGNGGVQYSDINVKGLDRQDMSGRNMNRL